MKVLEPVRILVGSVITANTALPRAEAVAIQGDRIVGVGSYDELAQAYTDSEVIVDRSHKEQVILPGLIDQHLHPFLGATTLTTAVIAPEAWHLPDIVHPAADTPEQYRARLRRVEAEIDDPDEWLFSWGYHSLWHGPLDRQALDEVSPSRPIGIWQRSCHEFYLNTAAIEALGITEEVVAEEAGEHSSTIDLAAGHFWENGFMAFLMSRLTPVFVTVERLVSGLEQMITYLHANGVTAFNEPGAVLPPGAWDLYQAILGRDDTPLLSSFIVDARGPAAAGVPVSEALARAEHLAAKAPSGKVSFLAKQIKLFADGAIISQLMQMKDPYLDADGKPNPDHHGEWLMKPEVFEAQSKAYWDAGYQLHVHVNGDLGLEMVLDTLERRLTEHPRQDHRTVVVHFATSTEAQVERIEELGAIVSSNPYYPVGFADKFGQVGLGSARADAMTRNRSVLDRGIPLSFHSDLPMGPADPLSMMWCAVNRVTPTGRVAGPEQRITAEQALHAVTLGAAYSWRKEDELGSIEVGKRANFTIVDADPLKVDPMHLNSIGVVGTVFGGDWFPVAPSVAASRSPQNHARVLSFPAEKTQYHQGCTCAVARRITEIAAEVLSA